MRKSIQLFLKFSIYLFLLIFVCVFFVASHIVPALATMTGKAIYVLSSISTVAMNANELVEKNKRLRLDLEVEKTNSRTLEADRNRVEIELRKTQSSLNVSDSNLVASRLEEHRCRIPEGSKAVS